MSHFWQLLSRPSLLRYVHWRSTNRKTRTELALRKGGRLVMRPRPATDYGVAYEVFLQEVYRPPVPIDPAEIRLVLDLGANVGYSCVYWCREYPRAKVIAYEPHPEHAALARETIARSGLSARVDLVAAAAGCSPGELLLSDAGSSSSTVIPNDGRHAILRVPCLDLFQQAERLNVDLLKIDIEGGEYAILADRRFAQLHVPVVVLEWHACPDVPEPERWCLNRLAALGYSARAVESAGTHGLIWAFLNSKSRRNPAADHAYVKEEGR